MDQQSDQTSAGESAAHRPVAPIERIEPTEPHKDPVVALLLNLFFFVVGYLYIGQWQKAIAWVLVPILYCFWITITCGLFLVALPLILSLPVVLLFDVYLQTRRLQEGKAIGQWTFFNDFIP